MRPQGRIWQDQRSDQRRNGQRWQDRRDYGKQKAQQDHRRGPVHRHNCRECVWIGTIPHPAGGRVDPCDLYVCHLDQDGNQSPEPIMTARYTQDSQTSMPVERAVEQGIPEFVLGLDLAIHCGVLDGEARFP